MTNGTQERLPDPKTFDPDEAEGIPHREEQISEILQWKLDVIMVQVAKIKKCLDKVIDCLDQIKLLLQAMLAALFAILAAILWGFSTLILIAGLILFFILFIVIRLVMPIIHRFFSIPPVQGP